MRSNGKAIAITVLASSGIFSNAFAATSPTFDLNTYLTLTGLNNPQQNNSSELANQDGQQWQELNDLTANRTATSDFEIMTKKISTGLKVAKTGQDLFASLLALFNGGCEGIDGILSCMASGSGFVLSSTKLYNDAKTELSGTAPTAGKGVYATKPIVTGKGIVSSVQAEASAANAEVLTTSMEASNLSQSNADIQANDPNVLKIVKQGTEWAQELQDNADTAVSTRATVQALSEGFANSMRFDAVAHQQVVDRIQGVIQNTAQTNKLLAKIINQEVSSREADSELMSREYGDTLGEIQSTGDVYQTNMVAVGKKVETGGLIANNAFDLP